MQEGGAGSKKKLKYSEAVEKARREYSITHPGILAKMRLFHFNSVNETAGFPIPRDSPGVLVYAGG